MVWVNFAKAISIFAVILLHVSISVVVQTRFSSSDWWIANLYLSAVRWCVPVFVMVSGALLLDEQKNESVAHFYKKRASRILIPLIAWTVVFVVWNIFRASTYGYEYDFKKAFQSIIIGRPHYHMWFLYMMVGLYFFAPFIRFCIRRIPRAELQLFVVAMFLIATTNAFFITFIERGQTSFVSTFLPYVPYFLSGHLIATSKRENGKLFASIVFVVSIILTAIGCYSLAYLEGLDKGFYFYDNLSITVIPMSISLMWLVKFFKVDDEKNADRIELLSSLAFGIYLVHPIFLESFRYYVFKPEECYTLLSIPFLAVIIYAISLFFSFVISRIPYLKRIA